MTFQKGEGVPPSITRALLPSCGHVGVSKGQNGEERKTHFSKTSLGNRITQTGITRLQWELNPAPSVIKADVMSTTLWNHNDLTL